MRGTYLLNMNKSSIIPLTLTLETEHEVQLAYELLGRINSQDIENILSISYEEAMELIYNINVVSKELEKSGYKYSEYRLWMTEITE